MILWLLLTATTIQPDKAAHFGVSASINLACTQTAKVLTGSKWGSLIGCSALTILIGGAKELTDSVADKDDFKADLLGVGFSAVFLSF